NKLIDHSTLSEKDFRLGFKYPYIYYFFVGKKIAESFNSSKESQEFVERLLTNLHREDFANILIFITHHTKDIWVLEKIKAILVSLLSEYQSATLDRSQLSFMDAFMKQILELILEQREIQNERDKVNQTLDEYERKNHADEMSDDAPDILAQIN